MLRKKKKKLNGSWGLNKSHNIPGNYPLRFGEFGLNSLQRLNIALFSPLVPLELSLELANGRFSQQ
jgi:hypothetical protein